MPVLTRRLLASCACVALLVCPEPAAAQARAFLDGVLALTAALEGTFGDEGARVGPALDRMDRALAEWDRTIRAEERRVAAALSRASTREAGDLRMALARMYAERGRVADALRELEAAGRGEPGRPDLLVLRGLVLDAAATTAAADRAATSMAAAAAFRAAWAIEPGNPVTVCYVIRRAATPEEIERARGVMDVAYRTMLVAAARPAALPFARISLLEHVAGDAPVMPLARYVRGYTRLVGGDYEGALAELRLAAAGDPLLVDPAARSLPVMRAVTALRNGRLAEARSLLAEVNASLDSSEIHRIRGLIDWASGDHDQSLGQLAMAIDRSPRDERARLARARVLTSAGRHADAERALLDTIEAVPDSALAHWWLGLDYEGLNRQGDARREIENVAAGAIAGRSSLHAAIGRLASNALDVPAAVVAFTRAVEANPNSPAAHKSLAAALLQQDRADEAFIELVAVLLIDPLDAGAYVGIGRIHLDAGRDVDAVVALNRAVALSPDHADARYALATALMRLGKTEEAAREFDRVEAAQVRAVAERRHTMSVDVLKEEAALRVAEGRYDRAIELYEKAATLGGDRALYRQLADLYLKMGRVGDATRARTLSERTKP